MSELKIAVSWAYAPSYAKPLSVPQGLITLMTRQAMRVTLAHPPGYDLVPRCLEAARENAKKSGGTFEIVDDMDAALADADIVYPKSWGVYDLMLARQEATDAEEIADNQPPAWPATTSTSTGSATGGGWAWPTGGRSTCTACPPTAGRR